MKVFIPRNISWWWLNMSVNIGPFSISIVQLIILSLWTGLTLALRTTLHKSGIWKWTAFMVSLPLFLICVFIAFFKYSELTLVPFIAKLIRTYFLDATRKFQINRNKPDPKAVAIAKSRYTKHDVIIEHKDLLLHEEQLDKLKIITEQTR